MCIVVTFLFMWKIYIHYNPIGNILMYTAQAVQSALWKSSNLSIILLFTEIFG